MFASALHANPTGPQVVHGSAAFAHPDPATLNVTTGAGTIINWQQFGIAPGELTRFLQPSAASAVLNRVTGQDPSAILGTLDSNGRVFLINPNGIVFGADAVVDTAGLIASTLQISDTDFLAGRLDFQGSGAGGIRNFGVLRAGAGGNIALIAHDVENHGVVQVENGHLLLAAGERVTITDWSAEGISYAVSAPDNAVLNLGRLLAEGGAVSMFGATLRNAGVVQASSVGVNARGEITLRADADVEIADGALVSATGEAGGDVRVLSDTGLAWIAGEIDAAGGATGSGGTVTVTGERVAVTGDARIDASGGAGGGRVLLGGERGGGGNTARAWMSYVGSGATVTADATQQGDGGEVVVWSDHTTRVHAAISARGAGSGGGGFVETSGKVNLQVTHAADVRSPHGDGGTWLLDPGDIEVVAGAGPGQPEVTDIDPTGDAHWQPAVTPAQIGADTLTAALAGGGVTVILDTTNPGLTAQGDITVSAAIDLGANPPGAASTLELRAHDDVFVNAPITAPATAALNVRLLADENDRNGAGSLTFGAGGAVDTGGGFLELSGAAIAFSADVHRTRGGDAQVRRSTPDAAMTIDVLPPIDAGAGTLVLGRLDGSGLLSLTTPLDSAALAAGGLILQHGTVRIDQPVDFSAGDEFLDLRANFGVELAADLDTGSAFIDASRSIVRFTGSARVASDIDIGLLDVSDPAVTATFDGAANNLDGLDFGGGRIDGAGAMRLLGDGAWNGGTLALGGDFSVAPGATLTLGGAAGHTLENMSLVNGGTLQWLRGDLLLNAATLNNGAGAVFDAAVEAPAQIAGPGNLTNAGTMDFRTDVSLAVPFATSGTFNVLGGTLTLGANGSHNGAAVLDVAAGANVRFENGDQVFAAATRVGGAGNVAFATGTHRVDGQFAVTGLTSLDTSVVALAQAFDNVGGVAASGATLRLASGGTHTGVFTLNNALLAFDGGSHTLAGGGIAGAGGGEVQLNGGSVALGAAVPYTAADTRLDGGALSVAGTANAGNLTWNSGALSGAGTTNATGIAFGPTALTLDGHRLVNAGDADLAVALRLANGARFTNDGDLTLGAGAALESPAGIGGVAGSVLNRGQVAVNGAGPLSVSVVFDNQGSVNVNSGTLSLGRGGNHGGAFSVAAGAGLSLAGNHSFAAASSVGGNGNVTFASGRSAIDGAYGPGGETRVTGATVLFNADTGLLGGFIQSAGTTFANALLNLAPGATFELVGGVLGGIGTVVANVNSDAGVISPGTSPGTLTIDGDLVLGADSVLDLELGGLLPGSEHDVLIVTGNMVLAGELGVSLVNNFSGGVIGDSYRPVSYRSRSGEFSRVRAPQGFSYVLTDVGIGIELVTADTPGDTLDVTSPVVTLADQPQAARERTEDRATGGTRTLADAGGRGEEDERERFALCR